ANILVNDEELACLTDFGLTVLIDASSTDTTTSGNPGGCPRWTAPEDFEYHQRSPKSDIFAFACVCFELYTTQAPLPQVKDHAVMHSVMHDVRSPRPAHEIVSDHSWDLMKQCWVGDPAARPSIQQVIDQLERLPGKSFCYCLKHL
ncbi:kinase-like domain-containing protein, partial [Mycena amicta]